MKTLHSLTSRGRIRVFFESANAPKEAAGDGEKMDKGTVIDATRNYLAALVLSALAATTTQVNDANAQTAEPTQIAAATVVSGSKCDGIKDRKLQIACFDGVDKAQDQELQAIHNKKLSLEQVRAQQKIKIAELKAAGLQDTRKSWEDVVPRLQALEKGDTASGTKGIGIAGVADLLLDAWKDKFNEFMEYIIENKIGNWQYAEIIRNAAQPKLQ